jgi:predicted amidohydrolase
MVSADYPSQVHLHDVEMAEQPSGERKPMKESGNIRPGKVMIDPVEIGDMGKVGLALCYDLRSAICLRIRQTADHGARFTEMHLTQRRLGADVLTFPSAWVNKTGHHWGESSTFSSWIPPC